MQTFIPKRISPTLFFILGGYIMMNSTQIYAKDHHDHSHGQSEQQKLAAEGIFNDDDVKNRTLSDWQGNWQSVYPYLLSGELQPVLQSKSEKSGAKSVQEYKDYYMKGYKTDINTISIDGSQISFFKTDNKTQCEYKYMGYKILTYASGNRGVRYLFECQDNLSKAPKYVQFSDHIIEPTAAEHFHIYMGNVSQEALLEEMNNWPTYYPKAMSGNQIVHEMLYH